MSVLAPEAPTREAGSRRLAQRLTVASLAIGAAYALVLVAWRDAAFAFTFDDAYYYFGIARNVADGQGSTFDGINHTNGYHPLWLLLCVPVYALGLDGMDAVRTLLVVQVAAYTAALVVLGRTVARVVGDWTALRRGRPGDDAAVRACERTVVAAWVLAAGNPFIVKVFVNGLESGISVLIYALLLTRFAPPTPRRLCDTSARWRAGTGLLLLLAFLARTDAAIVVAAVALWCVFEHGARRLRDAVAPLAELFAPVTVGALAYLVINELSFGTAMQVSGLHKRAALDGDAIVTFGVLAALALSLGVRTFRLAHRTEGTRLGRFPRVRDLASRTGWFAAACLVLLGYYTALQTQQWLWYYAPLVTLGLFLLPVAVADFAERGLLEAPADRPAQRALAPVQAILLLPLVVAVVVQTPIFADPNLRSIQVANRDTGRWIDANLPEGAVLGSWDAGVVGYFAGRPVVNLDGVANSYEFYEASRDGRIGPFLRAQGLDHLVNHGADVDGEDPAIRAFLAATFGPEVSDGATVVHRVPFDFSGVTVGSAGTQMGGDQPQAVFVYRVPGGDQR